MLIQILLLIHITKQSPLIIPFIKESLKEKNNFYSYFTKNNISTLIEIGTPYQKIPFYIKLDEFPISILGNKNKGKYNEIKSNTYNKEEECDYYFYKGNFEGCISNDIFNIKNEKIKFSFLLINNHSIESQMDNNIFGLTFYSRRFSGQQFIYLLKNNKIIDSYNFYFKYNEKDENGNLIIGNFPHEIDKNYDEKLLKLINLNIKNNEFLWKFSIDEIYFDDKIINEKNFIEIKIDIKGIIGTEKYNQYFKSNFIDKNNNKCQIDFSEDKKYKFYYCDKNVDISKIKIIKFNSKVFNSSFEFNHKDLWIEFNEKLYYQIIFKNFILNNENDNNWIFGELFLKKYLLLFNQDKKVIGIYENKKMNFPFLIILNIILVILVIVLGYYFKKFYKLKPRKLRVNELEENYDYTSYNNPKIKNESII